MEENLWSNLKCKVDFQNRGSVIIVSAFLFPFVFLDLFFTKCLPIEGKISGQSGPQERLSQAAALNPLECPSQKKARPSIGAWATWI